MFSTEDIIGDIVFISFRDPERYEDIGIRRSSGHFKVMGFDGFGVWVSHPKLILIKSKKGSNEIKNSDKNIDANFLISWDNIKTIMHYPERDGYDFPSEFDLDVGFKGGNGK